MAPHTRINPILVRYEPDRDLRGPLDIGGGAENAESPEVRKNRSLHSLLPTGDIR
jgi:hypothetical protein